MREGQGIESKEKSEDGREKKNPQKTSKGEQFIMKPLPETAIKFKTKVICRTFQKLQKDHDAE